MVKMRSTIDESEMDVSEEEAYALQAAGKAYNVADAERKAKAVGVYSSVTGRPDPAVPEAPESLSAAGTPGQHEDDEERADDTPVRRGPAPGSGSARKR